MGYRKFGSKYILRIDKCEELLESLNKFCKEHNIKLGLYWSWSYK
jgi:predicted DNA-binding protein with PD1-like motif